MLESRRSRWKSMEDLLAVMVRYTSGDVDLPLSGTSGRYGRTGYRLKSDVGS